MRTRRIAYLRPSTTMPANVSFLRALEQAFPEHDVEPIDLVALMTRRPALKLRSYLQALLEIGPLRLAASPEYWQRTRFFYHTVNELFRQRVARERFDFSVQIQSLFDGYTGIPHFVYTDHTHASNLEYDAFDERKLAREWLPLERLIYHHATKVFVRSSNVGRTLIDYYELPPGKVACIYAGPNAAEPVHRIDGAKYATQNILFVGKDWERKGGPVLVRAFEKVLSTHPDAQLTIVGCRPDVRLRNCHVVGRVPLERVDAYYEKSSIFCMPTNQEPFGIVFAEALNHALPIVATRVGAVPDMVVDDRNGYIVEPGNVEALAQKLCLLLDDTVKRKQFGMAGRALSRERYNWTQVGRRLRKHVLAALGDQNGPDIGLPRQIDGVH